MAATIERYCSACGKRHTFFLPDADVFDDHAEYEYTCPKAVITARMTIGDEWGNANVQSRPRDSVDVKQIDN